MMLVTQVTFKSHICLLDPNFNTPSLLGPPALPWLRVTDVMSHSYCWGYILSLKGTGVEKVENHKQPVTLPRPPGRLCCIQSNMASKTLLENLPYPPVVFLFY